MQIFKENPLFQVSNILLYKNKQWKKCGNSSLFQLSWILQQECVHETDWDGRKHSETALHNGLKIIRGNTETVNTAIQLEMMV